MLRLCLHDMLKAQFIGKAIETVGRVGGWVDVALATHYECGPHAFVTSA